MSSEYAEYRVESNLKLEERARQEAWREAGALQQRQRRLNDRVAQAEREYGSDLMGGRKRAPREPGRSWERPEIERYVRDPAPVLCGHREAARPRHGHDEASAGTGVG